MDALHTDWTLPCGGRKEDFNLLTMVISALKWRELNGRISLVTDCDGADFYNKTGLCRIWDGGIFDILENIPESINPNIFWAAGKIFAVKPQKAPIAVLDTDFIVWKKLDFDKINDLAVIHREELSPDVYPSPEYFKMKSGRCTAEEEYLKANPCNTAFYVIKNNDFIKHYTDEAIRFMENCADTEDNLRCMLYAEQRMFAICAARMRLDITEFSTLDALFNKNDTFTHTWGMKRAMREDIVLRKAYCRRCADRIVRDFPQIVPVLKNIEVISEYFA